jgi:hypothetical protein
VRTAVTVATSAVSAVMTKTMVRRGRQGVRGAVKLLAGEWPQDTQRGGGGLVKVAHRESKRMVTFSRKFVPTVSRLGRPGPPVSHFPGSGKCPQRSR